MAGRPGSVRHQPRHLLQRRPGEEHRVSLPRPVCQGEVIRGVQEERSPQVGDENLMRVCVCVCEINNTEMSLLGNYCLIVWLGMKVFSNCEI